MLNLGLESRRNRFGAAIVKAVLLFYTPLSPAYGCAGERTQPLASKTAVIRSVSLTPYGKGYKAFKASVMKSNQIEEYPFGVEPEIVAEVARTAISHQQQRDVTRCAAGLPARENRAELSGRARAAVPALVRLMLALACALASVAHAY